MPIIVRQDERSWHAGYDAGRAGKPCQCPSRIPDSLAWHSGYIEGKADRAASATRRSIHMRGKR